MPIQLPTNRIGERCGLFNLNSTQITQISNLAGEFAAMFSPRILPEILSDSAFSHAISVPIMDLVAADYLDMLRRQTGALDVLTISDLRVEPIFADAEPMRKRAYQLLNPFLKTQFQIIEKSVLTDEVQE